MEGGTFTCQAVVTSSCHISVALGRSLPQGKALLVTSREVFPLCLIQLELWDGRKFTA